MRTVRGESLIPSITFYHMLVHGSAASDAWTRGDIRGFVSSGLGTLSDAAGLVGVGVAGARVAGLVTRFGAAEGASSLRLGPGAMGDEIVTRVVNSNMAHAAERAVERAGFPTVRDAREALQAFGRQIKEAGRIPANAIVDTARSNRIIVPGFGRGGAVVYQRQREAHPENCAAVDNPRVRRSDMSEKRCGRFELRISDDDKEVAYLRLPTYPAEGFAKTSKTVRLHDLIGQYQGPDVNLDFDQEGVLVGIELLC